MSRRIVLGICIPIGIVLMTAVGVIVLKELRRPPLEKLHLALSSLDSARTVEAPRIAGEQFRMAEQRLIAGQQHLTDINESWWPLADYRVVDSLLSESIRLSESSIRRSRNERLSRNDSARRQVAEMKDSLAVWSDILDNSLPRVEENLIFRSASSCVQLADRMIERHQFEAAAQYADSALFILAKLSHKHRQYNENMNNLMRRSREWTAKTVDQSSRSGKYAVIVDKSRHCLFILSAGKVVDSMRCDLGYNSGHQKKMAGDGATPEGRYTITHINKQSKYYRALLLNYPNEDDKKRFASNLSSGLIPKTAKVGGLIEIHGHGGTGDDWTDGCVAVTNTNMDSLLKHLSIGATVTIVGSWEAR